MRIVSGLLAFFAGLLVMWFLRPLIEPPTAIPAGYYDLSSLPDDIAMKFSETTFLEQLVMQERAREKFMAEMMSSSGVSLPTGVPDFPYGVLNAPSAGMKWPKFGDSSLQAVLDSHKDEWVILNLWATWCAPCIKELPDMQRAAPLLAEHGVKLVAVNADIQKRDTQSAIDEVFDNRGITDLPNILTLESDVDAMLTATGLDSVALPTNLIFAPGGKPFAYFRGLPAQDEVWSAPEMITFFEALAESDVR